jgi:predicted nicotinamide N-methyase
MHNRIVTGQNVPSSRIAELRASLERAFPLQQYMLTVGTATLSVTTAEDMQALINRITEEEFIKDERFPYWAEVWHSAIALGEYLQEHPSLVRDKRVHEIGCGLGVPGMIAASLGARMSFSDYEEPARQLVELNYRTNGLPLPVEILHLDFRDPPDQTWDVILSSDVIYERRFVEPLAACLDAIASDECVVILAEPDRDIAVPFFHRLKDLGFTFIRSQRSVSLYSRNVEVSVYEIRRGGTERRDI